MDVLAENPLFFLINSYTTGFSPQVPANLLLHLLRGSHGKISSGEVGLPIGDSEMVLPCGTFARWESRE
jgi:23S rRNA (cytosine1962-C5)-methyltransferase